MSYIAVSQTSTGKFYERIYQNKPVRQEESYGSYAIRKSIYWFDKKEYDRQRGYSTDANDGSVEVPVGTAKKLTGRDLTPNDRPVKIM